MRKLLPSALVIILTLMTVIAIFTLKSHITVETTQAPDETLDYENKPDGTGLIFDDDGQSINIPIKPVHKNEKNKR